MILCACGCGKLIHKYGSRGRLNKFVKCHRTITDTVSNAARKNQLKGAETRRNKKLTKEFLIEEYLGEIAETVGMEPDDVAILLIDLAREGKIGKRNGGCYGNLGVMV